MVELKCIFQKNTQLWCKGFQCSKMFRQSSTKMNLSKHLHSAVSRNYQMREGVTLEFERFVISFMNVPLPFLPMGTPVRFCTVDAYISAARLEETSPSHFSLSLSSPAAAFGPCSCIVSFIRFRFQLQCFSSKFLRHSKILSLQ